MPSPSSDGQALLQKMMAAYTRDVIKTKGKLRIHSLMDRSIANGPGERAVIHLQGCSIQCPGCFNQETHDPLDYQQVITPKELVDWVLETKATFPIEGITISGGEPLDQKEELYKFLKILRMRDSTVSVILYTGYKQIQAFFDGQEWCPLIKLCDVVVCGPFIKSRSVKDGIRGSDNQLCSLISRRYEFNDLETRVIGEVQFDNHNMVTTGFLERDSRGAVKRTK